MRRPSFAAALSPAMRDLDTGYPQHYHPSWVSSYRFAFASARSLPAWSSVTSCWRFSRLCESRSDDFACTPISGRGRRGA